MSRASERPSFGRDLRAAVREKQVPMERGSFRIRRTPRNRLKSRVGQSAVFCLLVGFALMVLSIVTDNQFGWSTKVKNPNAGAPLLVMEYLVALLTLATAVFGGGLWYARMVLNNWWRYRFMGLLVFTTLMGIWASIVAFAVLGIIPSDSSSTNTKLRTTVLFTLLFLLCHNMFMIAYSVGILRYSREVDGMAPPADDRDMMGLGLGPPAGGRGASDADYAAVAMGPARAGAGAGGAGGAGAGGSSAGAGVADAAMRARAMIGRFTLPQVMMPRPSAPRFDAAAAAASGYDGEDAREVEVRLDESDGDSDGDSELSNPSADSEGDPVETSALETSALDTSAVTAETSEAEGGAGGGGATPYDGGAAVESENLTVQPIEEDTYVGGGTARFLATPVHGAEDAGYDGDATPARGGAAGEESKGADGAATPASSVTSSSAMSAHRTPVGRIPHQVNLTPTTATQVRGADDVGAGDEDDSLAPEEFEALWATLDHVGSFACYISQVPSLEALMSHLTARGFVPMASGVVGDEMKLFFYGDGPRTAGVFLSVLVFALAEKKLVATFKASDDEHLTLVQRFELNGLFSVIGPAEE